MKTLTPIEAAYIAGFLDGDGCILAQLVKKDDYILKYQLRVTVSFIQLTSRKHFLMKIQHEIGLGTIRERNDGISELNIIGIESVKPFLQQIQPFLRLKQKQANLVIRICEQLPLTKNDPIKFLELSQLSDQVARLNDSKKRTVTAETVKKTFVDLKLISE
jgi:LAGLIDADG endonuclease